MKKRSRRHRNVFRNPTGQIRGRMGSTTRLVPRRGTLESLEQRLALTGDVTGSPWQNPLNPSDVNADGYVSAIDALTVLNVLNSDGPGSFSGAATKEGGPRAISDDASPFLDVNGDEKLSAMDALTVINTLNTKQDILVQIRLETTDLAGQPISEINSGEGYLLRAFVEDVSPEQQGVFAAYIDVTFDSALTDVNGAITYGDDYDNGQDGDTSTPGLIDEAGAFDGLSPLGGDELLLFSVPMIATGTGVVTFGSNIAEDIGHEVLLFGRNTAVPEADIEFGQTSLTILGGSPTLFVGDVSIAEGNEGTTDFVFTVTLSQAAGSDVSVAFATTGGTAEADVDFNSASGTLTIPAGETQGTITVQVIGDTDIEDDETFTVTISEPVGASINDAEGVGTILDDDTPVLLSISVDDPAVVEGTDGTTPITFTISLNEVSGSDVTFDFSTQDGTAVSPDDYESSSGSLTIPAGETSVTITVSVVADNIDEDDETFSVVLSNAVGAEIADGTGVATITDDDETVITELVRVNLVTTDTSGNPISSVPLGGSFLLQAYVSDIRAEPTGVFAAYMDILYDMGLVSTNGDFAYGDEYPNGQLGDTSVPGLVDEAGAFDGLEELGGGEFLLFSLFFTADAIGDAMFASDAADDQDNDVLLFGLNDPVSVDDVLFGMTSITIFEDGGLPSLSIADPAINEGDSGTTDFTFTVTLSSASESTVTVDFGTIADTATEDVDYLGAFGTLTFEPGTTTQTITVSVFGDTEVEPDEVFRVELSNASGASIATGSADGTILNDDASSGQGSISGFVYADVNGSGFFEEGEVGIPGATIRLNGTDGAGTPVSRETVTNEDGQYSFDNLPSGSYEILEVQPGFFNDGIDQNPDFEAPGIAENDRYVEIALSGDQNLTGYHFGEAGLRAEFAGRHLFLASNRDVDFLEGTTIAGMPLWISFDEGFAVPVHIEAQGEGGVLGIAIYDANLNLLALTPPTSDFASLDFAGEPGVLYFAKVFGSASNVTVSIIEGGSFQLTSESVDEALAEV